MKSKTSFGSPRFMASTASRRPAGWSPAPYRQRQSLCVPSETLTIGVHISARKPSQRWPAERFARTMQAIRRRRPPFASCCFGRPATRTTRCIRGRCDARGKGSRRWLALHTWNSARPTRSGIRVCRDRRQVTVIARPTQTLPDLIAALAECRAVICADGGAMHLAAGLGLPVVCLFGNSGAATLASLGRTLPPAAEALASMSPTSAWTKSSPPSIRCGPIFRNPALESCLHVGSLAPRPPATASSSASHLQHRAPDGLAMRSLGWGVGRVASPSASNSS
jgi:hypothetical protein